MKQQCEYCLKNIEINTSLSMAGHLARCKVWNEKRKKILQGVSKEFLYEHHIIKNMAIWEISKMLGLKHVRELNELLKQYNIPQQTFFNCKQLKQKRKQKIKQTNNQKYNCDFGLSNKKVRQKIKKTCLKKYGVENVFASDEIKQIIEKVSFERYGSKTAISSPIIREKTKNTILTRYGVDNVFKIPKIIEEIKEKKLKSEKNQSRTSIKANRLFSYLYGCLLNTSLKTQIYYAGLNKEFGKKFTNDYFYYDFVLSRLKFCVEYNGSYYHADPRVYKSNFKIHGIEAKNIWEKDKIKIQSLFKLKFDIWIIWENDFENATDFYVLQILWRIYYLSNHPNAPRIIFESNIERDNIIYRTHNFIWEQKHRQISH